MQIVSNVQILQHLCWEENTFRWRTTRWSIWMNTWWHRFIDPWFILPTSFWLLCSCKLCYVYECLFHLLLVYYISTQIWYIRTSTSRCKSPPPNQTVEGRRDCWRRPSSLWLHPWMSLYLGFFQKPETWAGEYLVMVQRCIAWCENWRFKR